MAMDDRLFETLAMVAKVTRVAQSHWWVIGSAAVALHGATQISVGDVDILLSAEDAKAILRSRLRKKYEWLEAQLPEQGYLTGAEFTVADAYLFTVTRWAAYVALALSDLPRLQAYLARVAVRPAVQAALQAEGLAG